MSRGGAARQRAGKEPTEPSSRITAPPPKAKEHRRINWVVAVMVSLVLIGLVGGYFVALMGASSDPTTTTITTLAP